MASMSPIVLHDFITPNSTDMLLDLNDSFFDTPYFSNNIVECEDGLNTGDNDQIDVGNLGSFEYPDNVVNDINDNSYLKPCIDTFGCVVKPSSANVADDVDVKGTSDDMIFLDSLLEDLEDQVKPEDAANSKAAPSAQVILPTEKSSVSPKGSVCLEVNKEYRDFSQVADDSEIVSVAYKTKQGRPKEAFPSKLHKILENAESEGYSSIISWLPHGRAFRLHNPRLFVEIVMPKYFFQTKITSFQRQLNIYGFRKMIKGMDMGAYCNEMFLRGRSGLCCGIIRLKAKPQFDPETEPDFYKMLPLPSISRCPSKRVTECSHANESKRLRIE